MEREEVFSTQIGQAAWEYYKWWMEKNKRKAHGHTTFLKSKFFNTFVKFAQFAIRVKIPNIDTFIWLMCHKNYPPTMWTDKVVYSQYLEFLDNQGEPLDRVSDTIKTFKRIKEQYECELEDIFEHVTPSELIQYLNSRHISPWVLVLSAKFHRYFANKVKDEEKVIIQSIIRPAYWKNKINNCPSIVNEIKAIIKRLHLD